MESVVDYAGVTLQLLFHGRIKLGGKFMDMVLFFALRALQANLAATPLNPEWLMALFAFHTQPSPISCARVNTALRG